MLPKGCSTAQYTVVKVLWDLHLRAQATEQSARGAAVANQGADQLRRVLEVVWWLAKGWPAAQSACLAVVVA